MPPPQPDQRSDLAADEAVDVAPSDGREPRRGGRVRRQVGQGAAGKGEGDGARARGG